MADQRTNSRNADIGPRVVAQDILECSSSQKHKLGTRLQLGDRVFRYGKNAGTALTPGYIVGSTSTLVTSKTGAGTISGNYGDTGVWTSCTGTTALVTDYFAEGYLVVTAGSGVGETYKVKNNDALVTSATAARLVLYDGLASGWSTNSTHQIIQSPYNGLTISSTAMVPIGVPLCNTSANYYCWVQTWGPCGVWMDVAAGGATAKSQLVLSANTVGTAGLMSLAVSGTALVAAPQIGQTLGTAVVASIPQPVYLQISC